MTSLQSDDLSCFVCVADTGSISRAALALGVDQSTISRQIARLESALDARLFHRSGRGVVLTDSGTTLLAYARQVASTLDEARQAVRAATAKGPAQVVIAAQPTIATMAFAAIGTAIRQRFPATRVRFVEGHVSPVLSWLAAGEIDFALLYLPEQQGALKVDVLLDEDLVLAAPPGWAHLGPTFALRNLGELPLILPSSGHGLRMLAEALASRTGSGLQIAMESNASNAVTLSLVEAGCGATLLPLAAVTDMVAQGRVQCAQLIDPPVVRQIALASAQNRPHVPELWDILQTMRQAVRQTVQAGNWPGARVI
jgi:LysR family nitrogen assimilation transcriptional regulator